MKQDYTATCPATDDKEEMNAILSFDFHEESLENMVDAFGEATVKNLCKQKMVIAMQGWGRSRLRAGDSPDDIQAKLDKEEWKPGMIKPKQSKLDKAVNVAVGMSDDELAAYLERIQSARAAQA